MNDEIKLALETLDSTLGASINLVWIMLGAFLVFFMHTGFAMVEAGFTRSKNTINIFFFCLHIICSYSISLNKSFRIT